MGANTEWQWEYKPVGSTDSKSDPMQIMIIMIVATVVYAS